MADPPDISIIIPAFNAGKVIRQALESVVAQTHQNYEAIIVDDGSTDRTAAIAHNFCGRDPRFSLIRQANGGISSARNRALAVARGEWIAFLDADDVWFPEKLALQLALARAHPGVNFVFANFYFWDGKQDLHLMYQDHQPLPEGDIIRQLIANCSYCPSTIMVPRKTLESAGRFDPEVRNSEDLDLWLRIGEHGIRAQGIREPMGRYRRWPGSFTAANPLQSFENNILVLAKRLKETRREDLRPLYRHSLARLQADWEIIRVRPQAESHPGILPGAVWRAWWHEPRLKWLRWYLLLVWPKWLGGRFTRRNVHRKILARWQAWASVRESGGH